MLGARRTGKCLLLAAPALAPCRARSPAARPKFSGAQLVARALLPIVSVLVAMLLMGLVGLMPPLELHSRISPANKGWAPPPRLLLLRVIFRR